MQAKRQGPKKAADICGDQPDHMAAPKISASLFHMVGFRASLGFRVSKGWNLLGYVRSRIFLLAASLYALMPCYIKVVQRPVRRIAELTKEIWHPSILLLQDQDSVAMQSS